MTEVTANERMAPRPSFGRRLLRGQEIGIAVVLIAMMLFFGLLSRNQSFLQPGNIMNIIRDFSWIAIPAFGMTFVIISGGIDLSVGSIMAIAGLAAAAVVSSDRTPFLVGGEVPGWTTILGILLGLGVGALCGLANGFMITVLRLPPFIATLGMLQIARGIVYGLAQGWPIQNLSTDFVPLGRTLLPVSQQFSLPLPTLIMLIAAVLMWILLTRTSFGYRVSAVGGNENAARLSGINVRRTKILVYTLCGLMAGAGGVLLTARLGVAAPTAAQGYELDVIAAVVVGGTSMSGGEGSILGTLIGAAIMQVLRTGLNLIGVEAYWLPVAQGLIIVAAITLDQWYRRRQGMRGGFSSLFAAGKK